MAVAMHCLVNRCTFLSLLPLLGLLTLGSSCQGGGTGGDSDKTQAGAVTPTGEAPKQESIRNGLVTTRALLSEVARAELSPNGLLIDLGTADQHKYTLGGWKNSWGKNDIDKDGTTFAKALARSVPLRTHLPHGDQIKEVVLRLRAPRSGQKVSVLVDGKDIGNADVGAEWSVVRIPVPAEKTIEPGRHVVNLVFGNVEAGGARADIDWIWFSKEAGAKEPLIVPRVMPLSIGKLTRRALVAPTPRSYSFYLQVPKDSSLVFDYGAEVSTRFMVKVLTDDGKEETVFEAKAEPGKWKEAKVDLSQFGDRSIRLTLATEGEDGVVGWGEPEFMAPKTPENSQEPPSGVAAKNVIIILIDTVRADVFEPFAPKDSKVKVQTPAYNALAKEGTVFLRAYDNENWTKPSVATILSGLYPSTHGAKGDSDVLSNDVELLSERLKKAGFSTGSFIANGYCSEKFGFNQGWDFYRNYIREGRITDAENVYKDAIEFVKENKDKRFFVYIQTIDPHVPYKVPDEYTKLYHPEPYNGPLGSNFDGHIQADISKGKKKISQADYEWIKALYYGEVTYHDEHMGKFIEELKTLGLLDDTLLIITNDHGEELNEHGRLGHGHSLYDELIRSPLLMRFPPLFPAGKEIEEVTETVDITPTVLEVLGLPPAADIDGASLLPLVWNRPESRPGYSISEFLDSKRAIHVGRVKWITSPNSTLELFDIIDDPGEQKNRKSELLVSLRMSEIYMSEGLANPAKSQRQLDTTTQRRFESGKVQMDPELKRQLEALGYFGDNEE